MLFSGEGTHKNNLALRIHKITPFQAKLEVWPMPNLMAALPNIGGALCSTPQFG